MSFTYTLEKIDEENMNAIITPNKYIGLNYNRENYSYRLPIEEDTIILFYN